MFTFVARPVFTAPVEVIAPGETAPQTFTGRFQAQPLSETERLQSANMPVSEIAAANDAWLRLIFVGWEDDLMVDGAPFPVTPENIDLLLDAPWIRGALTMAYLRGMMAAARKN
jgi:hypothetical protein